MHPAMIPILLTKPVIVQDSFDRADNASSMGNADTGQAWTVEGGAVAGIISGCAYFSSFTTIAFAFVDAKISDFLLKTKLSTFAYAPCILFRYRDTSSAMALQCYTVNKKYILYKMVSGSWASLAIWTGVAEGDIINILCQGTSIQVYVNDILRISVNESANKDETKHGYIIDQVGVVNARWDDFKVEAI